LVKVVQAALIGSILANLLLVLGLAILVGGIKHGRQRLRFEAPRMIASLMMLAVTALAIPTLAFGAPYRGGRTHEEALSAACAILLAHRLCGEHSIRGSGAIRNAHPDTRAFRLTNPRTSQWWPPHPHTRDGRLWLVRRGAGRGRHRRRLRLRVVRPRLEARDSRHWLLGSIPRGSWSWLSPVTRWKTSSAFNWPRRTSQTYAMSTILNSSLQISIGLIPVLVLVSFFLGGPVLTLVMPPLLIAALLLTDIGRRATIVNDGETIWLEGVAFASRLYGIIAAACLVGV
jgi:Ca2+:H+ antiporter